MSAQRTAVITGATSERGIGIDVARRYAREGWAVVVLDLDGEKSAKVAADIGNQYAVPAFGYAVDVTSEESVAGAHQAVAAEALSLLRHARFHKPERRNRFDASIPRSCTGAPLPPSSITGSICGSRTGSMGGATMADTLERAVEASEIVDALKSFGVSQVDVAAVTQVSDRAVRGGAPATSALTGTTGSRSFVISSFCSQIR